MDIALRWTCLLCSFQGSLSGNSQFLSGSTVCFFPSVLLLKHFWLCCFLPVCCCAVFKLPELFGSVPFAVAAALLGRIRCRGTHMAAAQKMQKGGEIGVNRSQCLFYTRVHDTNWHSPHSLTISPKGPAFHPFLPPPLSFLELGYTAVSIFI